MLFIILLFVPTTACEWVEISQTYHVPLRPKQNTEHVADSVEYRNQTLMPSWSKATVGKVPHIGHIRKVPYASVQTPSRPHVHHVDLPETYNQHVKDSKDNNRIYNAFEDKKQVIFTPENIYENSTLQKSPETGEVNTEDYVHVFTTKPAHVSSNFEVTTEITPHQVKYSPNQGTRRIYIDQIRKTPSQSSADISLHSTTEILPVENNAFESHTQVNSEYVKSKKNMNETNEQSKDSQHKVQENNKRDDQFIHERIVNSENKMEGMWRAVKVVADTIVKHSRKTLKGKLKYLAGLKDTLIYSIEDHIDRVWPDDGRRSGRSAEHHVEIPSSESALMTISFLTFAVFLIKLVLQVIHTYKHKAMMVTPTVLAAVGRAAVALRRNRF